MAGRMELRQREGFTAGRVSVRIHALKVERQQRILPCWF